MTEALETLHRPGSGSRGLLLLLGGAALSLLSGLALGSPSPEGTALIALVVGIALQVAVGMRPFVGFLFLSGSLIFLVCFAVTENQYINLYDVLLPTLGSVAFFGRARTEALAEEARRQGPAHEAITRAMLGFAKICLVYIGYSFLSLIPMGLREGWPAAAVVFFGLVRGFEGVLAFPLALWLVQTERQVHQTLIALLVAGGVFAVVSTYQFLVMGVHRAGMTWVINHLDWALESANAAGNNISIMAVVLGVRHALRPTRWTYVLMAVFLFMLVLTQSRTGVLAILTLAVLSLKRVRWGQVVGAILFVGTALALAPKEWFARMTRTLTFEKGTFEVYSIVVRFYGYQSAWRVFLDYPIFGVGVAGTRNISHLYNDLAVAYLTAESFYLETAAGLGIVGVVVITILFWRLFQLGRVVLRVTPEGSLGHVMARFHMPLIAALMVGNISATYFLGLNGMGQVALWCGLLIQAGHLAVDRAEVANPPALQGGDSGRP